MVIAQNYDMHLCLMVFNATLNNISAI